MEGAWSVFDETGQQKFGVTEVAATSFRRQNRNFGLSHDGKQVEYLGKDWQILFSLSDRVLSRREKTSLPTPRLSGDGIELNDFNKGKPTLNGSPLAVEQGMLCAAVVGRKILAGGYSFLFSFDPDGKELWRRSQPEYPQEVNISGDGRFGVAAYGDGTIRWHRMSDGQELLALFPHRDGKRWVLWTPEGFFDHSPGGEELIGYHLNQGKDREAAFVGIAQMYDLFYRPDLVQKALDDDRSAIIAELKRIGDVRTILAGGLPPKVGFVAPAIGATLDKADIMVRLELEDKGGGVGRVQWKINGTTIGVEDGSRLARVKARGDVVEKLLTLSPGKNVIEAVVFNGKNTVASAPARLELTLKSDISEKPALHVLAVGVNQYRDRALQLKYAVPDATALAEALRKGGGGVFTGVTITTVADDQATLPGLEAAFAKLAGSVKTNDVFVFYLAGHGVTLDGSYHFLPVDFRYTDEAAVRQRAVTQALLQQWLAQVPARKSLMLLDTCESGSMTAQPVQRGTAEIAALTKLTRATGRLTLAASSDTAPALEGYEGHGVFTYALLKALGEADDKFGNKDGVIGTNEIESYVLETVPQLSFKKYGYEQVPRRGGEGQHFPMGVVVRQ